MEELERIFETLELFGKAHAIPPRTLLEINLALDEIFTNIVSYGFPDKGDHLIEIALSYGNHRVFIKVVDDGCPFDPLKSKCPDIRCSLVKRKIGGLGIHLAKKIMDRFSYRREAGKNILTMEKQTHPPA